MLGLHIIAEFYGVDPKLLDDEKFLRRTLIEAAKYAGARVIGETFHKFSPHGVTGVVAIAESHISIHTRPEFGYAAIDAFSCYSVHPRKIMEYLVKKLKPKRVVEVVMPRGEPFVEESPAAVALEE